MEKDKNCNLLSLKTLESKKNNTIDIQQELLLNSEPLKSKRKLASVQKITEIAPIPNNTTHRLATILGWQVIIPKNIFQKDQKVVYFEIDSKLPDDKEWAQAYNNKRPNIATTEFNGIISQGLCLPLTIIEAYTKLTDYKYPVGMNLSKILGITKYEDDADIIKVPNIAKDFPDRFGLIKTNEPRIQSELDHLERFKDQPYYASLKYDGTSATYLVDKTNDNEFYICSRNFRLSETQRKSDKLYFEAADKYKIKENLINTGSKYAIQCEIYGPNIQQNKMNKKSIKIAVFSIFDLENHKYLDYSELRSACLQMNLPMVETVEEGDSFNYTLDELKEKAKGLYRDTKYHREGLVFRLKSNHFTNETRHSFKIINDDFLLTKNKKLN